jgi:hypothetical protein
LFSISLFEATLRSSCPTSGFFSLQASVSSTRNKCEWKIATLLGFPSLGFLFSLPVGIPRNRILSRASPRLQKPTTTPQSISGRKPS